LAAGQEWALIKDATKVRLTINAAGGGPVIDLTPDHGSTVNAGGTIDIQNTATGSATISGVTLTDTGLYTGMFAQSGIGEGTPVGAGATVTANISLTAAADDLLNGTTVTAEFMFDVPGGGEGGDDRTFYLSERITGRTGNGHAKMAVGGSFAGLSGTSGHTTGFGLGSTAELLGGESYDGGTVHMNWTPRSPGKEARDLASDILHLTGIAPGNVFVLQMTYDQATLWANYELGSEAEEEAYAAAGLLHLLRYDEGLAEWVHAGNEAFAPFLGSWDASLLPDGDDAGTMVLGEWGVDTDANVVWAVTDHNSDFSTPEPGTMVLLAMGGIGILIRRRRRRA